MATVFITVWVCPRCLHYYASSRAGDLRQQLNTDLKQQVTFARSWCQQCGVDRKPYSTTIEVPDADSRLT